VPDKQRMADAADLGGFATQLVRVLGSPSRDTKTSKSRADSQPNPLRDGQIGSGHAQHGRR
jgi:hypothetical protein